MSGLIRVVASCHYDSTVDPTAILGDRPEHRDWQPGAEIHAPVVGEDAEIRAYVTVDAGCFRATRIGARTLLMKKVHIGHDALIGDDCEIAPLTSVGGECEIGNGVKVGQGATFKPRVKVGDGARIGMGAVVTKDVPAGETWVGNPARPLRKQTQGEARRLVACYHGTVGWEAFDPAEFPREVLDTLGGDR